MKKLAFQLVLMALCLPAMSQGWVYVHGTITDIANGNPVPDHPVTIMTDSISGAFYYNVVYTDSTGLYNDDIPVMSDSSRVIYVQTIDCQDYLYQAVIYCNPNSNYYIQDFQICNSYLNCHAAFIYYHDTINTPPYNYHFIDQSTGNINLWYWSFGDGVTSTEQSPYHSYQESGTYDVCLHISGADSSCYDFTCETIVVEESAGCQANFSYYPYPQGSPDSFHFYDISTGDITAWTWSFGDGTGSDEQYPFHTYPGPGTYTACLTITGNNCTDTFCQDIVISDTVYHHLYGQVYAGNFPLQAGTVMLFVLNPNGGYSPFGEPWPLDSNGVYYFTLVPDGNYLILAIPFDSIYYIPTYYGDVINWQSATQVILGVPDNPYNINLVMAGQMTFGIGSVSGQIYSIGIRSSEVEHINMILMNESWTAIGFSKVSPTGIFNFQTLDYGTYFLRAELPGVSCDNLKIDITPEKPRVEVYLNLSGNSILGLEDINPGKESISIYPNPVRDQLNILLQLPAALKIAIDIFNMTGQVVYNTYESCSAGQNALLIGLNDYPAGIYTIRISSTDGIYLVRKIIITK
jgi:PKD repeat protein